MKLEDRLLEIMRKYKIKFEAELIEKQKKETKEIIEKLNLQKMFNDEKRFNELNKFLNETTEKVEQTKEIFKATEKVAKNYNSVFNYMDNGKLDNNAKSSVGMKPILLKIFDDNSKDKNEDINDNKDDVFSILKSSFKDKIMFDEKGNLILNNDKKVDNETEIKSEKTSENEAKKENVEVSENESNNEDKQKNKNVQRQRYR